MDNKQLIKMFQSGCEYYFKIKFEQNKFLYFHSIPHNYFGTDYKVEITSVQFKWVDESILYFEKYLQENQNYGRQICRFKQYCNVSYHFKINSLIESTRQTKELQFYAESFEPFGESIRTNLICEDLVVFDNFRKLKLNIKADFKIENIDEVSHEGDSIGFSFFADVLRKNRATESSNGKIANHSFYLEIVQCHLEIEECLLTGLFHQQYLSDLLGKRYSMEDGHDIYMPNLNYNDYQYLLMIGFGFDRLYSFWDRIVFLLANYDLMGLNLGNISFDKYFKNVRNKIENQNNILFNPNSENLQWLLEFHKNNFAKITEYRHRIVHYQITDEQEGILSSKFANNASEYANKLTELKKVKLEFEGLGYTLYKHFNYCKEGFIRALKLIDELP